MPQNLGIKPFSVILHRHCIDTGSIKSGDYSFFADIAEQRDLGALILGQRMLAAAQQNIGLDAKAGQLADRMLGRLGLEFPCRRNIGHKCYMDRAGHLAAQLVAQLAQRFDERQSFDITDGPADFAQHEIEVLGFLQGELLDRIGDMRDHLDCRAKVIAATLTSDDVLVNPARGDVVRLAGRNTGEALVMPEVEISLRAVVGHIDLAVLVRAHRPRVDVQIGIELADSHAKTPRLQQCCKACCHKTFAERGDHAAGDKNVPRHGS